MKTINEIIKKTKDELSLCFNDLNISLAKKKFIDGLEKKTIAKYYCLINDKTFFRKIINKNNNDRLKKTSDFSTPVILKDFKVIKDENLNTIDIVYGVYDSKKNNLIKEVLIEFKIISDHDVFFKKMDKDDFHLLISVYNNGIFATNEDLVKCNNLFLKIGVLNGGVLFDLS